MKNWLILCGLFILPILLLLGKTTYSTKDKPKGDLVTKTTPTQMPVEDFSYIPQFVILSFDGSRSLPMWQQTLDFARQERLKGLTIEYTYFVSGVYFLTYSNKDIYTAPGQKTGESKIGFATNEQEVENRLKLINQALTDGHEIGSHLNGHFPGASKWSTKDWENEFSFFKKVSPSKEVVGFRAPNLEKNSYVWPVMAKYGYKYEAGNPGKSNEWPTNVDGIWRFILPAIKLQGTSKFPLAMDYNIYVTQTNGQDIYKRNSLEWQKALDNTVGSLMDYFNNNYTTNRAPVVFAVHFSEWNDGLYWEAMKRFADKVCGKDEVECTTYASVVKYMENHSEILNK
jgi:hypothetical protein